jgi:hypothetical protein
VPHDWDQIYFGGQHLNQLKNPPTEIAPGVVRAHNVNRTHAYAISATYMPAMYQWLSDYLTHSRHPKHHVDHRLGALHETGRHNIYAPAQWLAGQCEGYSNIKAADLPARWWPKAPTDSELPPFVAVIGLHRSGSSCLAGVLHKLGVHMGDRLSGHEKTGGFEALGLAHLCEAAYPFPSTELQIPLDDLRARLAEHIRYVRRSAHAKGLQAAGGKYPHLCAMGPLLKEICGDSLRVIHIDRPLAASIKSLQARSAACKGWLHISDASAEEVQRWLDSCKLGFLRAEEHLTVKYGQLLNDPAGEIRRIGIHLDIMSSEAQVADALSHVRPALRQHG